LDRPTEGDLFFYDQSFANMKSMNRFRAENVGFVFQAFLLLPTMTALQNVQVPMFESSLTARQRERKARQLLVGVGLEHRLGHFPNELSVGEKQRVAIARSLANDPPLLLADEPTGNLDSHSAEQILDLFDELHQTRELTIILVSHSDALIERATRLVRLRDGQIESDEKLKPIVPLRNAEAEQAAGPG
jgi:putative ABC transport system ATP-binding protein